MEWGNFSDKKREKLMSNIISERLLTEGKKAGMRERKLSV